MAILVVSIRCARPESKGLSIQSLARFSSASVPTLRPVGAAILRPLLYSSGIRQESRQTPPDSWRKVLDPSETLTNRYKPSLFCGCRQLTAVRGSPSAPSGKQISLGQPGANCPAGRAPPALMFQHWLPGFVTAARCSLLSGGICAPLCPPFLACLCSSGHAPRADVLILGDSSPPTSQPRLFGTFLDADLPSVFTIFSSGIVLCPSPLHQHMCCSHLSSSSSPSRFCLLDYLPCLLERTVLGRDQMR